MKCVHCGGEFTADQLQENQGACPHCGQPQQMEADPQPEETKEPTSDPQEKPDKPETAAPHKRSSLPLIVGAVVIILALAAVLWAVLGTGGQQVTAEQHNNPTVLTAFSDDAIRFAIGDELVAMYTNDAEDETERQYIANGLSISTPYIGSRNYVELANGEVVYLPMSFETSAEMVGKLYVRTADGEEKVLDENASVIYAYSDNAVYYNKLEDSKLVQTRYMDGELTPVSEIAGQDNIVVTKASSDNSLLQVIQLDDDQNTVAGGYIYNGTLHLLDTQYNVYNISDQDVFVVSSEEETGLVTLYRVSDLETGELEQLGSAVSEALLYSDGSMAFIADADLQANEYNPVGSLYRYDPATKTAEKWADNAVAILETTSQSDGWNENVRQLATSEMQSTNEERQTLYPGQLHYIDAQGSLRAVSPDTATVGQSGLEGFTIYEKFYSVNGYEIDYDIDFTAANNTYIYWGVEDQMYRYQLGSMQQPQVVTLDSSLAEQSTTAMQVGYLITGSGNVLEESDSRLVLKNFEDDSTFVILDNVGTITLVGMDNDGENVYFISEDNSLYSKAVESRSNPKRIASKVTAAVSTSDGLYFLQESENQPEPVIGESGEVEETEPVTDLMYLPYGQSQPQKLLENVTSISSYYFPQN